MRRFLAILFLILESSQGKEGKGGLDDELFFFYFMCFFKGEKRRGRGGFFALFLMFYVVFYVSLHLERRVWERFPLLFAFASKERNWNNMIPCFCLLFYKTAGEKGKRKIHIIFVFCCSFLKQ